MHQLHERPSQLPTQSSNLTPVVVEACPSGAAVGVGSLIGWPASFSYAAYVSACLG